MKVKCGKEIVEVSVESLSLTIKELKDELIEITNFTDIKLIHAGKVLKDDTATIGSIPGGFDAKLTMIGSIIVDAPRDDHPHAHNKRVVDDLSDPPAVNNFHAPKKDSHQPRQQQSPYRFNAINTLPGLPNQERARQILESLASDTGVLAVMQKHKWTVGALCELYPEGYVGVSDVCVMGLNENHGQRILLRLRTDDMQGFRNIQSVRKVLCHELAHNVHADHDDKFYVLMRQVEREIVELDWKQSKGKTLSAQVVTQYSPYQSSITAIVQDNTVHKLGGATDPLLQQFIPARYLAGTAAILRLSEEEKEVEDNCASRGGSSSNGSSGSGSGGIDARIRSGNRSLAAPEEYAVDGVVTAEQGENGTDTGGAAAAAAAAIAAEISGSSVESALPESFSPEMEIDIVPGSTSVTDQHNAIDATASSSKGALSSDLSATDCSSNQQMASFTAIVDAVLANIDETIAFTLSMESAAAPIDNLLSLRRAISDILTHIAVGSEANASVSSTPSGNTGSQLQVQGKVDLLLKCLRLLEKVVSNAKVIGTESCESLFYTFCFIHCLASKTIKMNSTTF